jgi:hypothetical protein
MAGTPQDTFQRVSSARRSAGLVIVLLLLPALYTEGESDLLASDLSGTHRRVERTLKTVWTSECELDACGIPVLFAIRARTPAAIDLVDVVVTVTLGYGTGPNDTGRIGVSYHQETPQPHFKRLSMGPGSFPLASTAPGQRTSTTLTWAQRALKGGGHGYIFESTVVPHRGADGHEKLSGEKITVIIDMLPAD